MCHVQSQYSALIFQQANVLNPSVLANKPSSTVGSSLACCYFLYSTGATVSWRLVPTNGSVHFLPNSPSFAETRTATWCHDSAGICDIEIMFTYNYATWWQLALADQYSASQRTWATELDVRGCARPGWTAKWLASANLATRLPAFAELVSH